MENPRHLWVGGLVAMGFDTTGKYLVVVSHSGRGVFSTDTWQRVARDYTVEYPSDEKAVGIGPIEGQLIPVQKRDERRDRLELLSPDGNYRPGRGIRWRLNRSGLNHPAHTACLK
jgi:hypothetical protein